MSFDLTSGLADRPDRIELRRVNAYYTEEEANGGTRPIIHLVGRTDDDERHVVHVEGFRPFFFISEQEWVSRRDEMQRAFDTDDRFLDYEFDYAGLDPEARGVSDLVKMVVERPRHVAQLRDEFDMTWEADIPFTDRFTQSKGITDGFSIPFGFGNEHTISHEDVESCAAPDVEPRLCLFDIEVLTDGSFPEFSRPSQPITSITAYDSYDGVFWTGLLRSEKWVGKMGDGLEGVYANRTALMDVDDEGEVIEAPVDGRLEQFTEERELLAAFVEWCEAHHPDIMSGWNSDHFDIPYLTNRCLDQNVQSITNLSPTGDIGWVRDAGGRQDLASQRAWRGLTVWDLQTAYLKSQIHNPKSKTLDYIATKELGEGKTDIDSTDTAYRANPKKFVDYAVRDVEALVGIEAVQGLLQMYTSIGDLTGTSMERAHENRFIIDDLLCRAALEYGGET